MQNHCDSHQLLGDDGGIVRVPFLVRGRLIAPPPLTAAQAAAAFAGQPPEARYLQLPGAQLLREPLVDRATMAETGGQRYLLMPPVDPLELIEADADALLEGSYSLSTAEVLAYLEQVGGALRAGEAVVARVCELARATAELPDAYHDALFAAVVLGLDPEAGRAMVDAELGMWGLPGHLLLDGWAEVPGAPLPELAPLLAAALPIAAPELPAPRTWVRAMPTRQLHITAGNAPTVPLISALRALLTKGAATIKLPAGAVLSGALLALACHAAAPDHPLTRHLSVVYWQGGDERVEAPLFAPGAYDRVVVWGAPGAVEAVRGQALFTRTVSFNPRYGVSLVGREALGGDLEGVALLAAADSLIYNQRACNAAMVHYVEGGEAEAGRYAEALRGVLARWDELAPQHVPAAARGQLRRLRRGRYAAADWRLNEREGSFSSGVLVLPDSFDILDHPLCRLVVVRPVERLEAALAHLHPAVSTAGVYPEARRLALRDRIAARGVSSVLPLGSCERAYAGMPHDGMRVLDQLVDWKNS